MQSTWLHPLPLIAILRGLTPDEAVAVGTALAEAGFHILEVPLNSPRPLDSIRRLVDALGQRCLIGAGTVLTESDVAEVAHAGGRLIVMPHTDPAIITAAKRANLRCVPGTATASEAFAALRAGADAIKVFPTAQVTPAVLHAWHAVLPPGTAVLPVGGVTLTNMRDYLSAGATGFGIGSAIYAPGRSIEDIAAAARNFIGAWTSISSGENNT